MPDSPSTLYPVIAFLDTYRSMKSLLHKMLALPGPYPERAVIEAIKRLSMLVRSSGLYMVFMSLPVVLVFWGEVRHQGTE